MAAKLHLHMESPCVVAPVGWQEANSPVDAAMVEEGGILMKPRGVAAMVGEYEETWWVANKTAFVANNKTGFVRLDIRRVRMNITTPRAEVVVSSPQEIHNRDGSVTNLPKKASVNFDKRRNELRSGSWLRIDPVLKELKITPNGLLTKNQMENREMHEELQLKLRTPEFFRLVSELNFAHFPTERRVQHLSRLLRNAEAGIELLPRKSDQIKVRSEIEKNLTAWYEAMAEGLKPESEPAAPAKGGNKK